MNINREIAILLAGTSLALDFLPIEEVRAMAGRVIEIRLRRPTPDLLQLPSTVRQLGGVRLLHPNLGVIRVVALQGLLKLLT